jgi:hypothetical protein
MTAYHLDGDRVLADVGDRACDGERLALAASSVSVSTGSAASGQRWRGGDQRNQRDHCQNE